MIISNQLLSEVLGFKAYVMREKYIHFLHNNRKNDLVYEKSGDVQYNINIYELADRCKAWALNIIIDTDIQSMGCVISSWTTHNSGKARILVIDKSFIGSTEVEAIIKACEYILQQTKEGI